LNPAAAWTFSAAAALAASTAAAAPGPAPPTVRVDMAAAAAAATAVPAANAGAPADDTPIDEAPPPSSAPPLVVTGYIDVGFAKAQGNGTSWQPGFTPTMPGAPADYYVDTFAPAVNSRGDVASTDPQGQPVDGFLPRSAGIGGRPSLLINTADVDLRYTASELPVLVFTRLQLVPRLYGPVVDPAQGMVPGEQTRLVLEQAFGRVTPLRSAELAISVGKFDSVFGIEYLDNQANFRIGVTPSLISRYTTGESVGAKVFYRVQLIPIFSAVSVNIAATNSGTFVESLQGPSRSLTGVPVGSIRFGYELNLERVSLKLGASGAMGPRNDQIQGAAQQQLLFGFDARFVAPTLAIAAEFVDVHEDGAVGPKLTGTNTYPMVTEFYAHGFYVQVAEELPLQIAPFRITLYGRYDRRNAEFEGYSNITVDRITGGLNVGIGESLQVKAEYLINRELVEAPTVANNVFASSVVWTW
jgi:hypothetical protein